MLLHSVWGTLIRRSLLPTATTLALVAGCASRPVDQPSLQTDGLGSATTPTTEQVLDGAATPDKPTESLTADRIAKYPGTGAFVGSPASNRPTKHASEDGSVELSFIDADIRTVVAGVLGEALGLDYTIDPKITGTITLQSSRSLGKTESLFALEAALRMQEFALVEVDGIYRVVPIKDAPRQVASLRLPESRQLPGFGIQVVPLRYVSAAEIEKILQPFAPGGAVMRTDEARNLLLLAGTGQELSTLLDVVRIFDVDWLAGMSFGLYRLDYVEAKTLTDELTEVFGATKSPLGGVVRLTPIPRLNSVLVVTQQPQYLEEVEKWVRRLDLGNNTPGRRIYVYEVQNAKADDLAISVSRVLTGSAGSSVEVTSDPAPRTYETRAEPPQQSFSSSDIGDGENALRIVPVRENNSLLILATPSEFGVIESALKRLDVAPRQVLIEASLAEVSLTDQLRFGIQWMFQSGSGTLTFSQANSGSILPQFPGFSYLYTGSSRVDAVLNALEGITNVKVISSPKLLVLNNHEAQLQVGDQVPIVTQTAISTNDPNAPIVNSVQLHDTGVILRVTPRVNQGGLILMEISQEISDVVATTTSSIDSPTIQQRRLSSTIAVQSGETIALGGLIRDNRSLTKSGLPWLQRIPLFGSLFGATDNTKRRTELIALITPRLIHDSEESRQVMQYLRDQFRDVHPTAKDYQFRP